MSTTGYTFISTEIKFKKDETYTSGGINSVFAAGITKGIHRGFRIIPSVTNRFVTIQPDDVYSDHVAIVENSTGFAITLRKSGSFDIDLSAAGFNSKTVVIAVKAAYSTSSATSASIEIFELSPSDTFTGDVDRPYLIVLGSVVVPAGNVVIPAANIKPYKRDYAWSKKSNHLKDWTQIIKNPSFEKSVTNTSAQYAADYWQLSSSGTRTSKVTSTYKNSGQLGYEFSIPSTGVKSGEILRQVLRNPSYSGMEVKVSFYLRRLIAASAGTGLTISLEGKATGGTSTTPTSMQFTYPLNATDGSFVLVEETLRVGATDVNYINLSALSFSVSATYGSTGICFAIDDVNVYIENKQLQYQGAPTEDGGQVITNALVLETENQATTSDNKALVTFDHSVGDGGSIIISNRTISDDPNQPSVDLKGIFKVGEYSLLDLAILPRIFGYFEEDRDFTNMFESASNRGNFPSIRLYSSARGELYLTFNAEYDLTKWVRDIAGTAAALILTDESFSYYVDTTGADFASFGTQVFTFKYNNGSVLSQLTNGLDFGKTFTSTYTTTKPVLAAAARAAGTSAKTLLFEFLGNSPTVKVRFYLTSTGQLEVTYNAAYSGTTWTRDAAGENSTKLLYNGVGIQTLIKTSATNNVAWNDASWTATAGNTFDISTNAITNVDGIYKVTSATASFSNPVSTTALTNEIRAVNMPKAWGYVDVVTGVASTIDGCNIASVAIVSGRIEITFAANMSNTTYSATSNYLGTLGYATYIRAQATNKVTIEVYDRSTGAAIDLTAGSATITFNVFGRQ